MRALSIMVEGIELDYVREDLKIREENNSFNDQLKVAYTTRPCRIVENSKTVQALGAFSINAARKKKYFPCKIVMSGVHYNGILTQNDKIGGFRKCDIKFGSAVNDIMDKPVADFFPIINVLGTEPAPEYSEESSEPHEAGQAWKDLAAAMQGKTYPEVKWQLPHMNWKGKFGFDLKQEDTHYRYLGGINYRMMGELLVNRPADLNSGGLPYNANIIAPQVFILSPLFYAFESLGYVLTGSFVNDPLFRRTMLLSTNDNMTMVIQKYPGLELDFTSPSWEEVYAWNLLGIYAPTFGKRVIMTVQQAGEFKVRYELTMPFDLSGSFMKPAYGISVLINGTQVGSFNSMAIGEQEGEIPFTISEEQIGQSLEFQFHSFGREMPTEYLIEFAEALPDLEFHDQHPTIDFSRYIPEWTVAEYLNNFKNLFNLKVDIDDVAKEVQINFNEEDYLIGGETHVISKSLQVAPFKNISTESYVLKYANDIDPAQFLSLDPTAKRDGNTTELTTEFKYIPHSNTADLSEAVADKDGVGLMIASVGSSYTTDTFNGRNLKMAWQGGIFETFWKRWILFRLNASPAVLKGPFTRTELYFINKKKKIYVDHQLWMVKAINYKENSAALFETELEVESVTF